MIDNVVYLTFKIIGNGSIGIEKKIFNQCRVLSSQVSSVFLVMFGNSEILVFEFRKSTQEIVRRYALPKYAVYSRSRSKLGRMVSYMSRASAMAKVLRLIIPDAKNTCLYFRMSSLSIKVIRTLKFISKSVPIFIEFPTSPWKKEYKESNGTFLYLLQTFLIRSLKSSLSGIIFIGKVENDIMSVPYIELSNGVMVEDLPLRILDNKRYSVSSKLHLIGVAGLAIWHGYDRLIEGIRNYIDITGKDNVVFHVVGDGSERPFLEEKVKLQHLEKSVIFHGVKTGKELEELFSKCHIAVGSLGLHRMGISEGSILKAREYCARGIPFILGSDDPDFEKDFPYVLRVPGDETPVDMSKVFSFAEKVLSDSEYSASMRNYAKKNLDWSVKMKKVVEFMSEVLESKVRR